MAVKFATVLTLLIAFYMPTSGSSQPAVGSAESTADSEDSSDGGAQIERPEGSSDSQRDDIIQQENPGASEAPDSSDRREPDITWNDDQWRGWQDFQYGTLAGMGALIATSFLLKPDFQEPRWEAYGPFDDWVRDRVNGGSEGLVKGLGKASDILYPTLGLLPLVLEDALMLPLARRSPDVALQTFLIDMQSIAFTSVFYFGGQALAGRARPGLSRCIEENGLDNCNIGTGIKSFFSGHAAIAFTGAGLICTHQAYLGVYNNDTVGRAMCGLTMSAASATAVIRLVANRHWASDVIAGVALGLFSGLALPRLIHFNPPRLGKRNDRQAVFFMLPDLRPNHIGVSMMGAF